MEVKKLSEVDLTENPVIGQMGQFNHEQLLFATITQQDLKQS